MGRSSKQERGIAFLTAMAIFYLVAPPIYLSYPPERFDDKYVVITVIGFAAWWIIALVVTFLAARQLYRKGGLTVTRRALLSITVLSYALTIYVFGLLYLAISQYVKCSFKPAFGNLMDAVYFSTTTIATVGFGDFVPNNSYTRALVGVEILAGVAYSVFFFSIIAGFLRDSTSRDAPARAGSNDS